MIPDLEDARATAESVMCDEVRITRDSEATGDDWQNDTTGVVTSGPDADDNPDAATVWQGRAMIRPESLRANARDEGGAEMYDQQWRVRIPAGPEMPEVKLGDVVTPVLSCSDPQLVDKRLTVTRVDGGTFSVTRILTCTVESRGPAI